MATNLYRKVGEMDFDGLLTDTNPAPMVRGGTIDKLATAATLKRGTVLSKGAASGKLFVLGETQTYEAHQDFTGDGTEDDFVVTAKPTTLNKVTVDGAIKTITTDYAYTASTGTITFTVAPATGKAITAYYDATDTGTPDCILCDDTDVGTSADVKVVVYTAGCFDLNKCHVATGYTITEAIKDKLRERGIVFKAASAAE